MILLHNTSSETIQSIPWITVTKMIPYTDPLLLDI